MYIKEVPISSDIVLKFRSHHPFEEINCLCIEGDISINSTYICSGPLISYLSRWEELLAYNQRNLLLDDDKRALMECESDDIGKAYNDMHYFGLRPWRKNYNFDYSYYILFSGSQYVVWLYTKNKNIFLEVTPIYWQFSMPNFNERKYKMWIQNEYKPLLKIKYDQ